MFLLKKTKELNYCTSARLQAVPGRYGASKTTAFHVPPGWKLESKSNCRKGNETAGLSYPAPS